MSKQPSRGGGKRLPEEIPPPHRASSAYVNNPSNPNIYAASAAIDGASSGLQPQLLSVNIQGTPGTKVAIPRTPYTGESSKSFQKRRTAHACDSCRRSKTGCSGGQPCSRCKMTRSTCFYGDGKRDREKRELSNLRKENKHLHRHNREVREALRQVSNDPSLSLYSIRSALDGILQLSFAAGAPDDQMESPQSSTRRSSEPGYGTEGEEHEADAEVGSAGLTDVVDIDTDRDDTRATGYMGKSSAANLQRRTVNEISGHISDAGNLRGGRIPLPRLASYHTEDADVDFLDTRNVDMYAWPDAHLANVLVQVYFDKVHGAFPLSNEAEFLSNYHSFRTETASLSEEKVIWLACLNTIFAISAVYAQFTISSHRGHHYDHLIYFARAKLLFMNQEAFLQDSRISSVCLMGLLSIYYLCTCRLNRAWTLCGLSIRHALTLGLHMRCEADTLSNVQKEHRVRIWWSLYSLECSLSELTGRPTSISDRDISTPVPLNGNEGTFNPGQIDHDRMSNTQGAEPSSRRGSKNLHRSYSRPPATFQLPRLFKQQATHNFPALTLSIRPSSYFIYRTQLSIITHEITNDLYSAATVKEKWSDVEKKMRTIDQHLIAWADRLPAEFDIALGRYSKPDINDAQTLSRTGLTMAYNFSRMLLFRPCMCRSDSRMPNHAITSKTYLQSCAQECVQSARRMIALLTWFSGSPSLLYSIPPFWNTLHCICEALSVLVLELAFKGYHLPYEITQILADAKKGVKWLSMMAAQSISARKAWEIFDGLSRVVALMINRSVSEMPIEAPVPPGYNITRFSGTAQSRSFRGVQHDSLAAESLLAYPAAASAGSLAAGTNQASGYSSFDAMYAPTSASGEVQFASSMLNASAVTERCFNIGHLHGQYDDPWQHLFHAPSEETVMAMVAPDLTMMDLTSTQVSELPHGGQIPTGLGGILASKYDWGGPDAYRA